MSLANLGDLKPTQLTVEEKARAFIESLRDSGFLTAYEKVIEKMFSLDESIGLPKDPLKYIKDNIGYTLAEARELEKKLSETIKTNEALEKENEILKLYLENLAPSEGSVSWSDNSLEEIKEAKDTQKKP